VVKAVEDDKVTDVGVAETNIINVVQMELKGG
jgi:hypothetical protein